MMKSYAVRPVSHRDFGVYDVDAINSRATIVYEGTQAECYAEKARLEEQAREIEAEEKAHEIECLGYDPDTVEPDAETAAELEKDATAPEIWSKDDERKALKQIMRIINKLPEDSYIKAAAEGFEEIAESNIESDFMESWKARCLYHIDQATEREQALRDEIEDLQNKFEAIDSRYDEKSADYDECNAERIERGTKLQEAEQTITELKAKLQEAEQTITALKAKLYDLMTA